MTDDRITLAHGDGGLATHRLVTDLFMAAFASQAGDSAVLDAPGPGRLALTTDSFVVSPRFFPGGDVGHLAICGTVNDLAVAGAHPLWLTAGFILEEGFPLADLRRVVASMAATAAAARVSIVAGDTKVVGRGQVDGCFINTSGVGLVPPGRDLGPHRVQPGDAILVSGPIGQHGVAVLSVRAGLAFETPVVSDAAPIADLAAAALAAAPGIGCMRDPTRGGLATVLAEIALASGIDQIISDAMVPVMSAVAGACEMLGLDPLYMACEGRLVAWCPPEQAEAALAALRSQVGGEGAQLIGHATANGRSGRPPADHGRAYLRTALGGTRRLEMLTGENLPRIC